MYKQYVFVWYRLVDDMRIIYFIIICIDQLDNIEGNKLHETYSLISQDIFQITTTNIIQTIMISSKA